MGIFSRKPNIKKLKEKRDIEGLIEAAEQVSIHVYEKARHALQDIIDESEAAGDVETITKIYQAAMAHSVSSVRAGAIRSLAKIKDKGAVEPLIETLRDPMCPGADMAREITAALAEINDERAVKPLIEVFSRKYYFFNAEYATDYTEIGPPEPRVLPDMTIVYEEGKRKLVSSPSPRDVVLEALAKMKEKAVGPLIEALLHPEDWNVGDDSTVWDVRRYAARALRENKDKSMVEPLIRLLKDRESNEKLRHKLYEGLREIDIMIYSGKTKDEIAAELLGQLHTDIIGALGTTKDERAVEPLVEILEKGEDIILRQCAALALGEIGDERAVEPLNRIVKGEASDSSFCSVAEEALKKIHGERG